MINHDEKRPALLNLNMSRDFKFMNQVMLLYLYVNKVCMLKCNTIYSVHFIIFDVSIKRSVIISATIFYI